MTIKPWLLATALALAIPVRSGANASELDGVKIPDALEAGGKVLHLNGYGSRKFSMLGIHIYVAALYLEHPSKDPQEIIGSSENKALVVRFERNVDAGRARQSWRDGLMNNCLSPCHIDQADMERFLSGVPAMHEGDTYNFFFDHHGASIIFEGHPIAIIPQQQFANAILATFLGPSPGSTELKQALLGNPP